MVLRRQPFTDPFRVRTELIQIDSGPPSGLVKPDRIELEALPPRRQFVASDALEIGGVNGW